MGWQCKICRTLFATKGNLLKHYRLQHATFGRGQSQPCLYGSCPCTFKTQSALRTHLSRYHAAKESLHPNIISTFKCLVCDAVCSTEKDFFQHIGNHLKGHETVFCVFEGCSFRTNIYNTFLKHKSRKHQPYSLSDLKQAVYERHYNQTADLSDIPEASADEGTSLDCDPECASYLVLKRIGLLLLKLESTCNASVRCIDTLVEDLHFISSSASVAVVRNTLDSTFRLNNCTVDQAIITDLAEQLCNFHPISTALGAGGPLSSAFKRRRYFKEHFLCVDPVEYILDFQKNKTFQYVPILKTLQEIVKNKDIAEGILSSCSNSTGYIKSIFDGKFYKQKDFYAGEDKRLSIILYVDDFEVCNPLGTSRKKHKITAIYWVLANLQSELQSELTSINLALLCKAVDVKQFEYKVVLEPLLKDLCILEQEGVFIPSAGKSIKGTVHCVAADNLGAHSISGLVESFTGPYICRFCLGHSSKYQAHEVRGGAFPPRTKEDHSLHVQTVKENLSLTHSFGVKRSCPLTDKLTHFHFVSGYPPDVLHDIFEGIVPRELALCIQVFTKNKYFNLTQLNELITCFSYKGSDKTNRPQEIPQSYTSRKSIGGNAHENWALIRLLPLIVGSLIPEGDSAWQVLLTLKDIVELVVAPVHTPETIAYLDFKISEHRDRFLAVFPEETLTPKHHFLEHYPTLIENYGPLVGVWTMRFEAKHSFFKQVVRHTNNFRNVLLTLSTRHQMMMAYHLQTDGGKQALCVAKISEVPLNVLHPDIQETLRDTSPLMSAVLLAKTVTCYGTRYNVGMILSFGSTGGLPDFAEIIQIAILDNCVHFIVKLLAAWYEEHLRSFQLEDTGKMALWEQQKLGDVYPLAAYSVGGKRLVTLKRHICCSV
ncbi:uncharacterized protein LOC115566456 isoform X2 [Sparus aurata]|nr:uncharacterized protein LOC115566456 isoform X2 [Sparus aurata]XP_030248212.1 uncharacterized protein LOC115566456 isoform X2 [Sparus aurata]